MYSILKGKKCRMYIQRGRRKQARQPMPSKEPRSISPDDLFLQPGGLRPNISSFGVGRVTLGVQ